VRLQIEELEDRARFVGTPCIYSAARSPWGEKAFSNYFGDDKAWQDYAACALIERRGRSCPRILVDQDSDDRFPRQQLNRN
jgi:S-formylglutathione hydrolase